MKLPTKEHCREMAREAGFDIGGDNETYNPHANDSYPITDFTEKLAALAFAAGAEAMREEAVKICGSLFGLDDDSCNEAEPCIKAIRNLKVEVPE